MKQRFLFAAAWLFAVVAVAQIPQGYYDAANGLTGEQLKAALHNIIDDHHVLSYDKCYDTLIIVDADPNLTNNVIGIYSQFSMDGPAQYAGGAGWNREHVWPQSRGGGSGDAYSDLHHLRAEDVSTNSARQSFVFDYAPNNYTDGRGNYQGATPADNGNSLWEPGDGQKGDVARMLFYMATRYEGNGEVDLELAEGNSSLSGNVMGNLPTLLEWHVLDPVDQYERERHERIFYYQKNRNPFVDHPEWVNAIWGDGIVDTPTISVSNNSVLNFGAVAAGQSSNSQSYSLSGANLQEDITITVDAPFELSLNNSSWSSSLTITKATAEASGATIYVRFSPPTANGQTYSEVISHASTGATAINLTVTGTEGESATPIAWINEVHYNDIGDDTNEFVEVYVENAQAYSLADFTIELIAGADSLPYSSFDLTTTTAGSAGYFFRNFGGIKDGPDAIKLLYDTEVLHFISYGGPVDTAEEVPVEESDETPEGKSLQLCCAGSSFSEMVWVIGDASPGQPNEETPLSIENQKILIYPNPTQGNIRLQGLPGVEIQARLFSLKGVTLFETSGRQDSLEVQLGRFLLTVEKGTYLLELRFDSERQQFKLQVRD